MADRPPITTPTSADPPGRSAYRTVVREALYCTVLGGLVGFFGFANKPATLLEGVWSLGQFGALSGAIIGFLVGFALRVRDGLLTGIKAAVLGCLFAALFVGLLGALGGAITYFTGGWNQYDAKSSLFGALLGAAFGVLYGFVTYRLERGKPGNP